jgi:hypothetical protein
MNLMFELSQLSRVDMQYAPIEVPDSTIGIFGKHISLRENLSTEKI